MLVGTNRSSRRNVGGVRIPFARGNGAYAGGGQSRDADRRCCAPWWNATACRGNDWTIVAAGAVIEAFEPMEPHPRVRAGIGTSRRKPRDSTCSAPAGTGLEAAILLGNKIALGQIDCAIAAGVRQPSATRRLPIPRAFNNCCSRAFAAGPRRQAPPAPGWGCGWSTCGPYFQASPNRGPASRWARARNSWGRRGGSGRRDQDQLALESHQKGGRRLRSGLLRGSGARVPGGLTKDEQYFGQTRASRGSADYRPHSTVPAAAALTAGNSTPMTDGAAAGCMMATEGVGTPARPSGAGRISPTAKWRPVDFIDKQEGLLMAPAIRGSENAGAMPDSACRTSISTRFTRLSRVRCCARSGLGPIPLFLPREVGLPAALGAIERAKLNVKGGSLAIGHHLPRPAARILATLAQDSQRQSGKTRPDFDLHGRRHGPSTRFWSVEHDPGAWQPC